MAELGLPHVRRDGRPRRPARTPQAVDHWKAQGLDLSQILLPAGRSPSGVAPARVQAQDHGLDAAARLRDSSARPAPALETRGAGRASTCRSATSTAPSARCSGARSPSATAPRACPTTPSRCSFTGSAGQSFGAFLPRGVTLRLEGDANDYCGQGPLRRQIDRLPAAPARRSRRRRTSSSATSCSTARPAARSTSTAWPASGSRVRNSGALAVVEGVGDHGCEYMTGGRVVVLGRTGRNFAAGMSGGVAYVLDADGRLREPLQPRDGRPRAGVGAGRWRIVAPAG